MSIDTSNKSNNNIIEISSDHTNYKTLNVEDATKDIPTPLPKVIDTDDQQQYHPFPRKTTIINRKQIK